MEKKLGRNFYIRSTLIVAKDLLGKYLVRRIGPFGKLRAGKIVETEAYIGPKDKASHAFGGKITERNKAEYLEGGYIYIYLVYGMYWQLNISTVKAGKPECVLIRALEPIMKIKNQISPSKAGSPLAEKIKITNQNSKSLKNVANGPGKLCRWLKLDKSFYGEDLAKSKRIWLADGEKVRPNQVIAAKRISIDYAGPYWSARKWRFYIKDNPFVSRK